MTGTDNKPWDAKIAYRLVYPLKDSFITPNYLTTLRLISGLTAFIFLSIGEYTFTNLGAFCFVISNFLDHADGELARITGKTSYTGHYYDLVSDALINTALFLGIGIGLMNSDLGIYAGIMGAVSGCAVTAIFYMRNEIEKRLGKDRTRQPNKGGIEAEDVLYLLPVITLLQLEYYFLSLATIGSPLFCVWVAKTFLKKNSSFCL